MKSNVQNIFLDPEINIINEVQRLIEIGGPTENDLDMIRHVAERINSGSVELKNDFNKVLSPILTEETLLGFTYLRPHGYPGDFELIDKIHTNTISPKEELQRWDMMYHKLAACEALRNRKKYLSDLIDLILEQQGSATILNVGSGPGRDIKEYFDRKPDANVHIDCVDMDINAINYAKNVCKEHSHKIRFFNENAIYLKPESKYDLVWSAGLFDYFSDKLFIRLIRKFFEFVKPNGQMALGNINSSNIDKLSMEVFGQWYLHHRSPDDLKEIVAKSGIQYNKSEVLSEPTGVNIFTHNYK